MCFGGLGYNFIDSVFAWHVQNPDLIRVIIIICFDIAFQNLTLQIAY